MKSKTLLLGKALTGIGTVTGVHATTRIMYESDGTELSQKQPKKRKQRSTSTKKTETIETLSANTEEAEKYKRFLEIKDQMIKGGTFANPRPNERRCKAYDNASKVRVNKQWVDAFVYQGKTWICWNDEYLKSRMYRVEKRNGTFGLLWKSFLTTKIGGQLTSV